MKIKGLQKTTLIDYPGKIACSLFLFGCNFRCGFCHNPELVLEDSGPNINEEEFFDFLNKRKEYLDGICISGGEPLLSLDLDFLRRIKEMGYSIKLDTNGSFPEKLKELIKENLVDFVAMDIKGSKDKYSKIAGVQVDIKKIEESIKLISGLGDYEFRTTILRDIHNKEELIKMGEWVIKIVGKKPKKHVLQGFKNRGKVLSKVFETEKDTSEKELLDAKEIVKDYFENVEVRE